MIKLDAGNVLLKPSHRRQLMTALRRALRLGERLGNFVLTLTLRRAGRAYELRAAVSDRIGSFACRARNNHWRDAVRDLIRTVTARIHEQCLRRAALA